MNRHPLSAAFPDMPEDDFANLVADIKANGLREHGYVYEGMVLDGWHRYRACEQAGVRFRYDEYKGSNPIAFVRSHNLERRHLTASQRAAAIVACHDWRPRGKSVAATDLPPTTAEMAREANVGVNTIEKAKTAHAAGLGEAVRDGAMSVETAAAIARGRDPDAKPAKKPDLKDRRIAELTQTNEALKDEMEQVREGASEAVAQAEAAAALLDTEPAKLILQKDAEIKRLTRDRDDYMNKCAELLKQVKMLERKLQRYEKAAA